MDPIKTDFPAMGLNGIPESVINMSGNRSPYTTLRPNAAPAGDSIDGVTGPPAAHTLVNAEVLGPVCAPQTTLFYPNAANHADSGRNVKLMPSRAGVSDFWDKRG
jgi:hypothetical protein